MVDSVLFSNPDAVYPLSDYFEILLLSPLIYLYFLASAFLMPLIIIIEFVAAIFTSYELQYFVSAIPYMIQILLPYAVAPIVATIIYFIKRDREFALKTLKILHCQYVCTFLFIYFDGLFIEVAFHGGIKEINFGHFINFLIGSDINYTSLLFMLVPYLIIFAFACYTLFVLGSNKYDEIRKDDIEKRCMAIQLTAPLALVLLSGLAGAVINSFILS